MSRFCCTLCSRWSKCKGPISPEINGKDVLIVGEQPGEEEEEVGVPLFERSPSGGLFRRTISSIGLSHRSTITNSVCCFSNGKPTQKQLNCCKEHWVELIRKNSPKVIIVLGSHAANSVLGRKVKITEEAGQMVPVKFENVTIPVVLCVHPSYILRMQKDSNTLYEKAEQSWIRSWEIVDGLLNDVGIEKIPEVTCLQNIDDIVDLLKSVRFLDQDTILSYDYETWGDKSALRPEICDSFKILTVGLAFEYLNQDIAVSFPFQDDRINFDSTVVGSLWTEILQKFTLVTHHSKYEHKCNIRQFGRTWFSHDTMLASNILDERVSARLGHVANRLGIKWAYYKSQMENIAPNPMDTPLPELLKYNALDALCTLKCYQKQLVEVKNNNLEVPLHLSENYAYNLAYVESNGYYVDKDIMEKVREEINKETREATIRFRSHKAVGLAEKLNMERIKTCKSPEFNPSSPTQMKNLCGEVLKLKGNTTKTGGTSYDKTVLEKYQETNPVIRDLLSVRSLESMKSGFLDKWEDFLGPTHCVHTNYTQTDVITGRLSSRDPNLQNIPKNSTVRRVFVSRFGKEGRIIKGDFNQLEPRILAGWSGDSNLCFALQNGFDLHLFVAASINGINYDDAKKQLEDGSEEIKRMRTLGKRMNLGNMYGQTEWGLAQKAGITESEAVEMLSLYDQKFPGVNEIRNEFKKHALKYGWVEDLFGRRRRLAKVWSPNPTEVGRALRQAGNAPIQSSGNQMCLISLCLCMELIKQKNLKAVIMGPTHDSLDIDVHPDHVEETVGVLKESMECHNGAYYWKNKKVDITVKIEVVKNLLE